MGGYLIRGLVELITNARDSGRRMYERGQLTAEQLSESPVEIEYNVQPEAKRLVVRDRFEGMTAEVMTSRLLQYGNPASDFDVGAPVRGINSRGAKDVGSMGEVKFESIAGAAYAECVIRWGMYSGPTSRPVTTADRDRLQISHGNGTVVTLLADPEVPVPRFDTLAIDLARHIELRYQPEALPRIPLHLREAKRGGREQSLTGFVPEGIVIVDQEITVPEYSSYAGAARLRLFKSDEQLQMVSSRLITRFWKSEAGIIVCDGRTAHDITFFHAQGQEDAAAQFLFGELLLPHVPALLKEFEEFEKRREVDPTLAANPLNPSQVTDPDRLGLNVGHPFVRAIEDRVRPLVEQALLDLQRELSPSAQERVGAELRAALDKLGEQLAERLDLGGGGPDTGDEQPLGLRLIPGGLRLEVGKTKRLGVYFKMAPDGLPEAVNVNVSASSEAVQLSTSSLVLLPVAEQVGLFRGSFEVTGRLLSDVVVIQALADGSSATARVSVREPTGGIVELDRDLQFSQRRYTSVPGRRKRIEIFADETLTDQEVEITAAGEKVALTAGSVRLEFDAVRGIAVGSVLAESGTPSSDTLRAKLGQLTDETLVVFQELETKPRIEFKFDETENFGAGRRFKWDIKVANLVHIAARHPTLKRVLGPDVDANGVQWPGQHDPQSKAILAELISDAYVVKRLQQELPSLGTGSENLVDPVDYDSHRYTFFEECFLLCHEALTPAFSGGHS